MNLPNIPMPEQFVELPVLKKTVTIRAMSTSEEKLLLLAKDAGSDDDILHSIMNLIKSCLKTTDIDVDHLYVPDIMALFINIIDISKGSEITHLYRCNNIVDGQTCNTEFTVIADLKEVKFTNNEQKDLINAQHGIFIKLKYPDISTIQEMNKKIELEPLCIESIINGDEIITEFSTQEIVEWYESLPVSITKQIHDFLYSMPTPYLEYKTVCPRCGAENIIRVTSLKDFFTNDIPAQQY